MAQGRLVITRDIREEARFEFPEFVKAAGVVDIINVPIFFPGGKAFGLLQVDSRKPWDLGEQEIDFLRTYSIILGPVIDRLYKVHQLQQALTDNQTLLRELQHRIKNNIAAVVSHSWALKCLGNVSAERYCVLSLLPSPDNSRTIVNS